MTELEVQIHREQIRLIYNQGPVLVFGATACAVLVTIFLWRFVPRSSLLLWLAAVGITTLLRLWVIRSYMTVDARVREQGQWGLFFWLGTLSAGMIWGVWPLMFYQSHNTEHLLLISTVFAGMVAVSAASGSIYLPSFLSFSIPLVLPLAIAHLWSGNESLRMTGLLLLMFLCVSFFLAARSNRQYRELIQARFENQDLMRKLAGEKGIAQQAVIAKNRFLAAASHDLRQPLHALGLFLSALRKREHDADQLHIIDDMAQSAQALNNLFSSLLDVSRLDAEIIDFNPIHLRVDDLFDRLRAQFGQQCEEKGLQLKIVTSGEVIYTDGILFERVLRNLISNAVQYTRSGEIEFRCESLSNGVRRISLSDTGIGIPANSLNDVFSEYHQLNNPERDRGKGLGLGLAIVKRLCDLMDTPLSLDSDLGRGTRFSLLVPGGDPAQIVEAQSAPAVLRAVGRRVLVVDDERQVLLGMRHMLEGWGCEVMLAESARDALKVMALADALPDLILSDYRLRGHDTGVDAVATVREATDVEIPAIIVTGDTSPERLEEVKQTGLMLLHKPVAPDELLGILNRMLGGIALPNRSGEREAAVQSIG